MGVKTILFWIGVLLVTVVIWRSLNLPEGEEMQMLVKSWLDNYGLITVFIGSILEALLFIGLYFPGSILIFLAVGLASSPTQAASAVLAAMAGMAIGYVCNFYLGRYGWYRVFLKLGMRTGLEKAKRNLEKNALRYFAYTFWNPGLASFTATASGILRFSFIKFLSLALPFLLAWNMFWGILVYSLGEYALNMIDYKIVLMVLVLWLFFEASLYYFRKYKSQSHVS